MWVDFTMTASSTNDEDGAKMHFISEAEVAFDESNDVVELRYNEPSETEDIKVQMIIMPDRVYVFRTGEYDMEQSFELSTMTQGELKLEEGILPLSTTTKRLDKAINYAQKDGKLSLDYTMFVQNEYSGDFHFDMHFYSELKEQSIEHHQKV